MRIRAAARWMGSPLGLAGMPSSRGRPPSSRWPPGSRALAAGQEIRIRATTRRMGSVAGHAGVFSTAGDVALFAQALLDRLAGRPSNFPLKRETLELMTTPEQPKTALGDATTFTPDGKPTTGIAERGFGWDINTAFSRPRGEVFPIGSFGHTGFTGTSLWMDPASDTYIVLLANSVHPRGASPISPRERTKDPCGSGPSIG